MSSLNVPDAQFTLTVGGSLAIGKVVTYNSKRKEYPRKSIGTSPNVTLLKNSEIPFIAVQSLHLFMHKMMKHEVAAIDFLELCPCNFFPLSTGSKIKVISYVTLSYLTF